MKGVTSDFDFSASMGKSKAISESPPPTIPPAMLSSRCALRSSFRLSPPSLEWTIPGRTSIHDTRCTKWGSRMHYEPKHDGLEVYTTSVGQYYIHRLIWSSAEDKFVELSAHCPHDNSPHVCNCPEDPILLNAIRKIRSEVIEKHYEECLRMSQEEVKKRSAEESQRSLEDTARILAKSYEIISQATEKAERARERSRKMEEDRSSKFNELLERRAAEAEKSIREKMERRFSEAEKRICEWIERRFSDLEKSFYEAADWEAVQRLELENEDDGRVVEIAGLRDNSSKYRKHDQAQCNQGQ